MSPENETPAQLEQRLRAQMAEALPEIVQALKRRAKAGNLTAIKLLLSRCPPELKAR